MFSRWTRREFLTAVAGGGVLGISGVMVHHEWRIRRLRTDVFVARVSDYSRDIAGVIREGLLELGISPGEIKGKRILLKPNLVETSSDAVHINTSPLVVRGAIEAFRGLGAAEVMVGEGAGHCRDSFLLLEESGLQEVLLEDRIRFIDLNDDDVFSVPNPSQSSRLKTLTFPRTLREVDWVVSMPKLKTHHWAGVTLSMKNMFGVMPGSHYGWPKNVLHWAGIHRSIIDINTTFVSHLAIADGIVGMEGDGPIMGTPRTAEVLVMGRNLPAVDATCARIMAIDPRKIPYLAASDLKIGTIRENAIFQRGEAIEAVQRSFFLEESIPAQRGLRL